MIHLLDYHGFGNGITVTVQNKRTKLEKKKKEDKGNGENKKKKDDDERNETKVKKLTNKENQEKNPLFFLEHSLNRFEAK